MKITIECNPQYSSKPHVIIQCQKENEEVKEIQDLLHTKDRKMIGTLNQKEYVIDPDKVLYGESVDGVTFLYTREQVYRIQQKLSELENTYRTLGYFRCSKSVVLNINAIAELTSEVGNRIDAGLCNGEHIIISRRYAKELRAILRGEK